jgi:16S rRNA pseudouridine516 synthase
MALVRLDKLISDGGAASRREAKALVQAGRVLVDGRPAASAADKYDPEAVSVTVNGVPLGVTKHIYLMLNKPAGVLSATEDPRSSTVLDLLPEEYRRRKPFPVGRLDKDTTGLLLLTDDGDFAHRVISPRHKVPKLYEAEVEGTPTAEDVRAFEKGLRLSDGTECLPARLLPAGGSLVRVEVFEGRYHQVKRMLASRGAAGESPAQAANRRALALCNFDGG